MPNSGAVPFAEVFPVANGCLAAVVTHLEMRRRPPPRESPAPEGDWQLERVTHPSPAWYRDLYETVGRDWLWFSRLELDDLALAATIDDPAVEVYELRNGQERAGMLELDRRRAGEVELAFLGLVPAYIGRGIGSFLMAHAIDLAWRTDPSRFWVHTCTLDHPGALQFYIRSGFVPYRREVEIVADPRLRGVLPREAAPRHPVIR